MSPFSPGLEALRSDQASWRGASFTGAKLHELWRPYRLEMTSKLRGWVSVVQIPANSPKVPGKTMYDVWGDTITDALAKAGLTCSRNFSSRFWSFPKELKLSKAKFLVNCASQEMRMWGVSFS